VATGEAELEDYEWNLGDEILHPEFLEKAIDELLKAVREDGLHAIEKVREHVDEQAALRQSARFGYLLTKIATP